MPSDRTTADSRRVVCPGQRACLDGIDGPIRINAQLGAPELPVGDVMRIFR